MNIPDDCNVGLQIAEAMEHQGRKRSWLAANIPASRATVNRMLRGDDQVSMFYVNRAIYLLGLDATLILH